MSKFYNTILTIAILVVASICCMGSASAAEIPAETETTTRYTDVADSAWYAEAVEVTSQLGVFHGYADGSFRPQETVTESEALTAFFNASKYFKFGQIENGEDNGAWYSKAVNGMQDAGLVNWTFSSNEGMVRENVAFVAASYLNYVTESAMIDVANGLYTDLSGLTADQVSAIGACAIEEVMIGKSAGTFGTGDLTRAELSAVIFRMLKAVGVIADDNSIVIDEVEVPKTETPDPIVIVIVPTPAPTPAPVPAPSETVEEPVYRDYSYGVQGEGATVTGETDGETVETLVEVEINDSIESIGEGNDDGYSIVTIEQNPAIEAEGTVTTVEVNFVVGELVSVDPVDSTNFVVTID